MCLKSQLFCVAWQRGVAFKTANQDRGVYESLNGRILGRYIPGDSIIQSLDPRSKLFAMIPLVLIVFWANNLSPISFCYSDRYLSHYRAFSLEAAHENGLTFCLCEKSLGRR